LAKQLRNNTWSDDLGTQFGHKIRNILCFNIRAYNLFKQKKQNNTLIYSCTKFNKNMFCCFLQFGLIFYHYEDIQLADDSQMLQSLT
jgi:hypothetical protein